MIDQYKALFVALLAAACRDPSTPVPATSATAPPTENHAPAQPAPPDEPSKANPEGRHLTEAELIAVLIESNFQKSTSEVAKDKLTSIGTPRESRPIDAAIEVRADAEETHFLVAYARDGSGGWQFSYARATQDAPDASAATELYSGLEGHLTKRFGSPAWTQNASGPPPIKGWHVGEGALEVTLLQRNDEHGRTVLEVTLAEPEGEAN
jgi:hypothetical protein